MGMTNFERMARKKIQQILKAQHYPRYAKLLGEFDLNITNNPDVTACIQYDRGRIIINGMFDGPEDISVIIRHELCHGFLQHYRRLVNHVAKTLGLDPNNLTDMDIKKIESIVYSPTSPHNIVADFDISNQAYTDKDKELIKNMVLAGRAAHGLITEEHKKDWVNLSLEEMWDKAMEERKAFLEKVKKEHEERLKKQQKEIGNNPNAKNSNKPEFIDGSMLEGNLVFVDENGVEYGI